jgi:hypothetical protein
MSFEVALMGAISKRLFDMGYPKEENGNLVITG